MTAKRVLGYVDDLPLLAPNQRYPWHRWLNGQRWTLRRGEQFETTIDSLVQTGRKWAQPRGLKLRSRTVDEDTVQIQAVGADGRRLKKSVAKMKRDKRRLR